MALIVEVREIEVGNGFIQFAVIVNGTELKRWWSKDFADHHKKRCLKAWNIENIGKKKGRAA